MAKEIEGYLKLQVPAGQANPSPPIGPALGQRGLNIMEFSKAFNDATKDEVPGTPLPTTITIYVDKSFTFKVKAKLLLFLYCYVMYDIRKFNHPINKKCVINYYFPE